MRELVFPVPKDYDGIRLKNYLRSYCGVSARLMTKLKRQPLGITNNGCHAIVTDILKAGDIVGIRMLDDEKQIEPVAHPLSVVYEDDDLLVVNKPSDMPMYPSPGHDQDSLANAVSAYYEKNGQKIGFRPVYRLDKDTTGLVVLAKNSFVAAYLAGSIKKVYYAICEGELSGSGVIDNPVAIKKGHGIQREVSKKGEKAVTNWKVLSSSKGYSLLALELETGRTHQIRVHLSHFGYPLAGDDMYGGSTDRIARQALHCGKACFSHPITKDNMELSCEFPSDMQHMLQDCNMESIQIHI
jgi:23S rRNA pseudouridine1911/1915/1917 synthase